MTNYIRTLTPLITVLMAGVLEEGEMETKRQYWEQQDFFKDNPTATMEQYQAYQLRHVK